MSFKDSVKNRTGEFLTKSQEMFERIFAQATQQLKIKHKPKPATQDSLLTSGPVRRKPSKENLAKQPERIVSRSRAPEKPKGSPAVKARSAPKLRKRKGSGALRGGLLLVLLLVLAGFLANHFAIIDVGAIFDLLGLGSKPVVQAPMPRKQTVKPAEKPVAAPKPSQSAPKASTPPPAPTVSTPVSASSEDKLAALETPTTTAQPPPVKQQGEKMTPPVAAEALPKPPQVAAAQQTQPAPGQTQATAKPAAPEIAPSKPVAPQYPYSVYLGSFKAPEAVRRALSDYQEKGLTAYWARVDLGEKGIWYRFFAGYFRTKEEAEKYISERKLQGAAPRLTRYANWIGSYSSEKDAEDRKKAIVSAGFYPYVIKEASGRSLLYSGAFDRKDLAEKEHSVLAAKGIKSEIVER